MKWLLLCVSMSLVMAESDGTWFRYPKLIKLVSKERVLNKKTKRWNKPARKNIIPIVVKGDVDET